MSFKGKIDALVHPPWQGDLYSDTTSQGTGLVLDVSFILLNTGDNLLLNTGDKVKTEGSIG